MFSLTELNSGYVVPLFLLGLIENLPPTIKLRWDHFVMMALAHATDLLSTLTSTCTWRTQDKGWQSLSDSSQSRVSHLWKKVFLLFACEWCHTTLRNKELLYSFPISSPKVSMKIFTVYLNWHIQPVCLTTILKHICKPMQGGNIYRYFFIDTFLALLVLF